MSNELDSDLYEDLYGADESAEFPQPENSESTLPQKIDSKEPSAHQMESPSASNPTNKMSSEKPPGSKMKEETVVTKTSTSLPATASTKSNGNVQSLSYSAQIAQQFSQYQQTPSQERQQRSVLPANPMIAVSKVDSGPSAIASYESRTENESPFSSTERPVRPSEMKDEGKMFIGGLSWDTTDESLRNYFGQFGRVDASTILRDPDGRSRGFAFLTFEDAASVNAVMCREHFLDGKAIDPKRAIPRSTHLRSQRFFVGGLSPTSTNETLRAFFEQFGKIVDANVMADRETGRNKGFGFVTFEDLPDSQVERLVGGGGWEVDGKTIEVKLAQPRSSRPQNSTTQSGPSAIGTYTSEARSHSNTPPPPNVNRIGPGNQDMIALYQRMIGHMGGMMNNGGMNPMTGPGMGLMAMGGVGMGGMGMGMGGGGMMAGMNPMMGAGIGGGMNPMMAGGMMGTGMGMQGAMGMNGMSRAPAFNGSSMQGGWNGVGDNSGSAVGAMRLGFGPMSNMNAGTSGGHMAMSAVNPAFRGRGSGMGPARVTNRGQHNFHPYSR